MSNNQTAMINSFVDAPTVALGHPGRASACEETLSVVLLQIDLAATSVGWTAEEIHCALTRLLDEAVLADAKNVGAAAMIEAVRQRRRK